MHIDQIYEDGQVYDRLFAEQRTIPTFWYEVADEYGDPILELACGTGRIAIPLAEQGHQVTGIDLTEGMLAEARRKSAAAGVIVDWRQGDMRSFALEKRFKLAYLAANSLCHLHTLADFQECMAAVRSHLERDGRFIVEVFVPDLALLLIGEVERRPFGRFQDPGGAGEVVVTYSAHYDRLAQIRYNTTYFRFPGRAEEVAGTLTMRMYFPQELDALFQYNGFAIEHKYGGFDRRPFDANFTTQLFVLTKQ